MNKFNIDKTYGEFFLDEACTLKVGYIARFESQDRQISTGLEVLTNAITDKEAPMAIRGPGEETNPDGLIQVYLRISNSAETKATPAAVVRFNGGQEVKTPEILSQRNRTAAYRRTR